jgi:hypothetical protein
MPGMALDQDAEEAFERTDNGAVDHHRLLLLGVLVDVEAPKRSGRLKSTCVVPHCQSRPMASFSVYSNFGP